MKTLTKEQKDWFKDVGETHRETVLKDKFTKTKNTPAICYLLKDGTTNVVFVESGDVSPMQALKPLVEKFQPEAYMFCAESWVLIKPKHDKLSMEDMRKQYPDGIRNHPDRKEHLIFMKGTMQGYRYLENFEIKRSKNKRITKLIQLDKPKSKQKLESDRIP